MQMLVFWRAGRLILSFMVEDLDDQMFSLDDAALLLDGVSNSRTDMY